MKKYFNEDLIKIIISVFLFIISFLLKEPYKIIALVLSYIVISIEIYKDAFNDLKEKDIFNENLLMIITTITAFIIKNYTEAVIVMLLFEIGEYLSDLAVDNSKKQITKLLDLRVDKANLVIDDIVKVVPIKDVKVGDIFVAKPGEKIPLDGIVIEGKSSLDTKALTGEAVPRTVTKNEQVLSGYINRDSILKVKATTNYKTSTASKIIDMIENSNERKTDTEKFIRKFSKIYTPTVVFLAIIITIIPTLLGYDFNTWLYRSLIFLVTSCPCAIVISPPLGYFCGIGRASREGIIIKGSKELEKLSKSSYLLLDKTGTITEGVFEVVEVKSNTKNEEEFLDIVTSAEENSIHPIATAIKNYYKGNSLKEVKDYKEISGKGISCTIGKNKVLVGNSKLMADNNITIDELKTNKTIVYVAINEKYEGYIIISDKIKDSSRNLYKLVGDDLKDIIVLSGDNEKTVADVCRKLKIKTYYSNLLPLDKVNIIKKYQKSGNTIFVGDGINDAPVLKISDIGISMGNIGSDAAIEASDTIIMHDDLDKIKTVINISKLTKRKIIQNISFALIIKFLVLLLSVLGLSTIWMAVFADVGVTLISILSVLTIMWRKIK